MLTESREDIPDREPTRRRSECYACSRVCGPKCRVGAGGRNLSRRLLLDCTESGSVVESVVYSRSRVAMQRAMNPEQLAAISRLFSSSVVREMARKGKSPLFARLATQSLSVDSLSGSQYVYSLFNSAFSILEREGNRHEYIYKAALTHKILLGRHSLQTASMLNEFRVGQCKADLVILNGTSTVYEVKSERDSLSRLERQVAAYATVFAQVYVIAAEKHVDAVNASVPKDVGIMRLNSRRQIS